MKNLILSILILFSIKAVAQKFEGTIKWTMKSEITDPKQKAQMEEAQMKMNDPATQAQMKQMQEKLNDPQFKAMMEANPQMKAQMEKMMGMVQGGGDLSSLIPKGFTVKVKNENALTKIEGGMFSGETLYIKAKDQLYTIDRPNKTYSIMNPSKDSVIKNADVKVKKTTETAKILNYNCTKYIVDITTNGNKMTQYVWTTTEIKDFDLKALAKQRFGKGQKFFYEEMEGVPLKIEASTNGINMNMEVTEIKKEALSDADFTIPADFKETPGMFR